MWLALAFVISSCSPKNLSFRKNVTHEKYYNTSTRTSYKAIDYYGCNCSQCNAVLPESDKATEETQKLPQSGISDNINVGAIQERSVSSEPTLHEILQQDTVVTQPTPDTTSSDISIDISKTDFNAAPIVNEKSYKTSKKPQLKKIHSKFNELNKYTIWNVKINGEGNVYRTKIGGKFKVSAIINHHCESCGGAINQIIAGIGGHKTAQSCLWSGMQYSNGDENVKFDIRVPNKKGTYYIRTRYAQDYTCANAVKYWWRIDRPNGPESQSNIGVIIVE